MAQNQSKKTTSLSAPGAIKPPKVFIGPQVDISGPYKHPDDLYTSVGKLAIYGIITLILMVIGLGALVFFQFNKASAQEITSPERSKIAMIQRDRNLLDAHRKLAIAKVKETRLQSFYATVTGYTAVETCGSTCTMANGQQAYYGAVACPRRIALGTLVNIEGMGVFKCTDRTATWVDGRFDIFFGYSKADHQRAINFGKQTRLITINKSL